MDASSALLLRLADPVARADVLTSDALLAIAATCYDLDPASVPDPVTAVYDRVDVAVPITAETMATARIMRPGDPAPWDITAGWDAPVPPGPGADLVWTGSVVVRVSGGDGTVDLVEDVQPDPELVLAAAAEGRELVGVRLSFSAPTPPAQAPLLTLPVVVAFVVGDGDSSPRDLLRSTTLARRAARPYPLAARPPDAPLRTVERCVCWVLPAATFDDAGWPGGGSGGTAADLRAARLGAARVWLATQGIAVIAVP